MTKAESTIGTDWLIDVGQSLTEELSRQSPTDFNEDNRYLPESVTSMPGYIRYAVNPYMREIVDCFDVDSPVREVVLKKGVQITYTTALESGMLYYMAHIKTLPMMYITADKELANARIENNVIPMINQSGFAEIVRSSDVDNTRKTGKTAKHIQWEGGGYLVPYGAKNADKMRSYSICVMLQDEIDAWPDVVGKDGDPVALCDDRCSAYWSRRKIFRGSTPLIEETSKVQRAYLRGDQRQYHIKCKHCGFEQPLRWRPKDKTAPHGGFRWDMDESGILVEASVRFECMECGGAHYEHDKTRLFDPAHGARWVPTAKPQEPGVRSYHLPALYSPVGMQPWAKCVQAFLRAYDPVEDRTLDVNLLQVFYNNILAEPFSVPGSRVDFSSVSAHRRTAYREGEVPNEYAYAHTGSKVLMLVCTVDVQKYNLAVGVFGVCRDSRMFLVNYWRYLAKGEHDTCDEPGSSCWTRLDELIRSHVYTADDGTRYPIAYTLVDSRYATDTVSKFCARFPSNVYPIIGRDRPAQHSRIREFTPFENQAGHQGYQITVDHYKDRLATVLRRPWDESLGDQPPYHFNAPIDLPDRVLNELTAESRREKIDATRGFKTWYWYRPSGKANELWDLLVYANAAVEIIAYTICIQHFELESIDWPTFWKYIEQQRFFQINADK